MIQLTPDGCRVLGVLIEKALTVPGQHSLGAMTGPARLIREGIRRMTAGRNTCRDVERGTGK
jgi:hypothetical protein